MLNAASVAKLFKANITATHKANELREVDETPALLAREAAVGILAAKDDAPLEVHETVDGFIVAGSGNAVMLGHTGDIQVMSEPIDAHDGIKGTPMTSEAFLEATKGLLPEFDAKTGTANYVREGKLVAMAVKRGDKTEYLAPVEEEKVAEDAADRALNFIGQARKAIELGNPKAADAALQLLGKLLKDASPETKKWNRPLEKALESIDEAVEEAANDKGAALEKLHEAYMAISSSDAKPYDADAPYSCYGANVNFRTDHFFKSAPDYSVAAFVLNKAVQEVMSGDLGKKLADAVRKSLKGSDKVKALEIELRESEEAKAAVTESVDEMIGQEYDLPALRDQISTFHGVINATISDKLGPDDDATLYLSQNERDDYIDARFRLGQRLEGGFGGGPRGKWVSAKTSQGIGNVSEAKKDADAATAAIVQTEGKLELRAGTDGEGDVLATVEIKGENVKEAHAALDAKAKEMGYEFVPEDMKHPVFGALENVLIGLMVKGLPEEAETHLALVEKALETEDADAALESAEVLAEIAGVKIPAGIVEGLSARKHRRGRKPSFRNRMARKFKINGPKATGCTKESVDEGVAPGPIRQTGPGSEGTFSDAPSGPKGIDVGKGEKKKDAAEGYTAVNAMNKMVSGQVTDDEDAEDDNAGGVVTKDGKKVTPKKDANLPKVGAAEGEEDPTAKWIVDVRKMSVDEFVANMADASAKLLPEDFRARVDALVEAYKNGPGKKDIARKITAVNPIVKKKTGKGISLEGIAEHNEVAISFPKGRVDEFLVRAQEAGSDGSGEVQMLDETVTVTVPKELAAKLKATFAGSDVTFTPVV